MREKISGVYDYDAKTCGQWWFGAGMSYTTFEYSDFKVDKPTFAASDTLTFSVNVRNSGKRKGNEVVMLYTSDVYASMMPDNRRLRAFDDNTIIYGYSRSAEYRYQ